MAPVYFDSSALMKLLVVEEGTTVATELWDEGDVAIASRLAYPEVRAAVAASARSHALTADAARAAARLWREVWPTIRTAELTPDIERRAGDLADDHALSGADAMHLASALAVAGPGLVVATWDRRLAAGAVAAGLTVVPTP